MRQVLEYSQRAIRHVEKEDTVKFHTFERFSEEQRFDLKRTGMRVVVAAIVGAGVLAALVMALPSG